MSDWKSVIPWLLSIATILIGIWQYADKQAQANREPFLKEQLKLVFEASDAVSTLATTTDTEVWATNRDRFWALYWGPLGVVESNLVARCMVFAGSKVPRPGQPVPPLPLTALNTPSIALSHAARQLILDSWSVDLPQLDGNDYTAACTAAPRGETPGSK